MNCIYWQGSCMPGRTACQLHYLKLQLNIFSKTQYFSQCFPAFVFKIKMKILKFIKLKKIGNYNPLLFVTFS